MSGEQQKTDMEWLIQQPQFLRFLYRTIQNAGLFEQGGSGSHGRDLAYAMGRRDLALDMLSDAEAAQALQHPDGTPILTTIQMFREAAQSTPKESKNERYDRRSELGADDDAGDA